MMITARTTAQDARRQQAVGAWEHVLDEVLRSGFFGTAAVEITVQDGALQLVRRRIEQIERPVTVVAEAVPSQRVASQRGTCRAATNGAAACRR